MIMEVDAAEFAEFLDAVADKMTVDSGPRGLPGSVWFLRGQLKGFAGGLQDTIVESANSPVVVPVALKMGSMIAAVSAGTKHVLPND